MKKKYLFLDLYYLFFVYSLFFLLSEFFNQVNRAYADEPKTSETRILKAEDEDFSGTPFTQYGEFNQINEEEEDDQFLQFGRFFGFSIGGGVEFVSGNRGALWQGGFPVVDIKLHYWFNFNFALDLGFRTAQHYFQDTSSLQLGRVNINLLWIGLDIKYYLDTQNLSAPISFANPYFLLGLGAYSKTQLSNLQQTQDNDTSMGVSAGAGIEFVIHPQKTYFALEGKAHFITFLQDTYTTLYQNVGLQDLTGIFYSITGSILFTW